MNEHAERNPAGPRGAQGEQGAPGQRGQRGLSQLQGRAVVVLFLIAALSGVASLFWTGHDVNASKTAIQAAQHREQETQQRAQQRAAAQLEQKLCASFGKLAVLQPPAGDPDANPSRAYLQGQHIVWREVLADLNCGQLSLSRK